MADPRLLNLMGVTEINIARMVLRMASPVQEKPCKSVEAVGHDCVLLNAILVLSSPGMAVVRTKRQMKALQAVQHPVA